MPKEKVKKMLNKAKDISEKAGAAVTEKAVNAAEVTKNTIDNQKEKIESNIAEKKQTKLDLRQAEVDAAMELIEDSKVENFILDLRKSELALNENTINKIKKVFPIPREQCVLWADAEFDLRPSGIVATEKGIYIRTDIDLEIIKKKSEDKSKAELFFYPWDEFEESWFISDSPTENKALLVETQCSKKFIAICKERSNLIKEREEKNFTQDYVEEYADEKVLSNVTPVTFAGIQSSVEAVFLEQKSYVNNKAGHGEMVEKAITKLDRLEGINAKVVGGDNAKNGADRQIGKDVFIQTKYYNSARGSLESSFSAETGEYRYINQNTGEPMQLEVPKDQYEKILEGFKKKIAEGKVKGVTDPKEAENIVRKGKLTYKQAVNLTKAGTIESLTYDAVTGVVTCSITFGITFVASVYFDWKEKGDMKEALQVGAIAGARVFGVSFLQHMIISQLARTSLASTFSAPTSYIVEKLGYKTSTNIVNGIRALSGKKALSGAAASKHLAKLMRSNVMTTAITFTILSVPNTYNLVSKRISTSQYTKNMGVLIGSMLGSAGGMLAGGLAVAKTAGVVGTAVAPGVGTAVGIAGGFVGGAAGVAAAKTVGDVFIEDDLVAMSRLLNAIISCMVTEYLLDAEEIDILVERIGEISQKDYKVFFEELQKTTQQEMCIRNFLEAHFEEIVNERESLPEITDEDIVDAIIGFEIEE